MLQLDIWHGYCSFRRMTGFPYILEKEMEQNNIEDGSILAIGLLVIVFLAFLFVARVG